MNLHCLQHVPFETPGIIEDWIREKKYTLSFTRLYQDEHFPSLAGIDAIIIMGGPMSIHDEPDFSWLKAEKAWIANAISLGKKIIGICLGAQLLADALGAKIYNNPEKEIGFFPLQFTRDGEQFFGLNNDKSTFPVFHWHGETFDLPKDAVHLASSEGCTNQAFVVGCQLLGLQFHPEVTPSIVADMIKFEGHELVEASYIQTAEAITQGIVHSEPVKKMLITLLDQFFA